MKQAIMTRWVAALRSKKYKQTTGKLRLRNKRGAAANSFCCLGVLCDLFAQEHPKSGWVSKAGNGFLEVNVFAERCVFASDKTDQITERSTVSLPNCVKRWAGLKTIGGDLDLNTKAAAAAGLVLKTRATNLAELNDDHKLNFSQIADVVEKHWRKL